MNELLGGSDMTWACPEHAQDMAGHMRTHMGFIKLKIGPKPTQIQTFWRIKNKVLTHIMFDTANTTENCKRQIEERIQKTLDAQYKPPPILWTNKEYLLPIAGLYAITIICFTILCVVWFRPRPSSGPRRQDLMELANRRDWVCK